MNTCNGVTSDKLWILIWKYLQTFLRWRKNAFIRRIRLIQTVKDFRRSPVQPPSQERRIQHRIHTEWTLSIWILKISRGWRLHSIPSTLVHLLSFLPCISLQIETLMFIITASCSYSVVCNGSITWITFFMHSDAAARSPWGYVLSKLESSSYRATVSVSEFCWFQSSVGLLLNLYQCISIHGGN